MIKSVTRHGKIMRTLETRNGNVLVAGGKIDGVPRWAYFFADGGFIRYASQREWNEALENWGVLMESAKEGKFIFPALNRWEPQETKKTDAGKLCFFWRWRHGANRRVQQSAVKLDGMEILKKDDMNLELTPEIGKRVNLIESWRQKGFSFFGHRHAINTDKFACGWYTPIALISQCWLSNYDNETVQRAVEFIGGAEEPKNFKIEFFNDYFEIFCQMVDVSGRFTFTPEKHNYVRDGGDWDDYLVCSKNTNNSEKIYNGLLWIFLNPLREELSKK